MGATSMDIVSRDAMLTLSLTPGLGPTLINRCVQMFGSAQAVLDASVHQLAAVRGIGHKRSQEIRQAMDELDDRGTVNREKELINQFGATVFTRDDPRYPQLLHHIPDPPPVLYTRGELYSEDALALAVVGTRRCTAYGREQADRISSLCAQAGLCIVSGGARGIDASAHRAALRVYGRTIVVLGSGLARPYPSEHKELFDTIASGHGAIVSEWPMGMAPRAENFPRRNRIISGLALGVLVVESPLGSGAMITARLAAEEHGREVMALPGRVDSKNSAGCNKMIREGWAALVTNSAEVLDALGDAGQLLKVALPVASTRGHSEDMDGVDKILLDKLTETQRRLYDTMKEPKTLNQLAAQTGFGVSVIQADLTYLEIRGLAVRDKGLYQRQPCPLSTKQPR